MKRPVLYFTGIIIILLSQSLFGQEMKELPQFTSRDRVLILAPHPDDEAIGTAGVIQKALKAGASVKVVCFTNGDNNELSFIIYEKRFVVRKRDFIRMGEMRRNETISGMEYLGVKGNDLIFLGYPDYGTLEILTKYWGDTKPFRPMSTRASKVPYPECPSFGAPYVGESVLKDIKTILKDYKPTKVFVSHPADRNRDHKALYLFLRAALWDLENEIPAHQLFTYIVHIVKWPKPKGYNPGLRLEPPPNLTDVEWTNLTLDGQEVKTKHECILQYKSQIEYNPPYLVSFARKNELFDDLPEIALTDKTKNEDEWKSKPLIYARKDGYLYVRMNIARRIEPGFGMKISLLGYKKGVDFAKMPKINVSIENSKTLIADKRNLVSFLDAKTSFDKHAVTFKIPLKRLNDPDRILACARSSHMQFEDMAWRILKVE